MNLGDAYTWASQKMKSDGWFGSKMQMVTDWLVSNYYVKNVLRYGLVKKLGMNSRELHSTVVSSVFGNFLDLLTVLPLEEDVDLFNVPIFKQSPQTYGTLFYFVQSKQYGRQIIAPNHPRWNGVRIVD